MLFKKTQTGFMKLIPISLNEDKTNEAFASTDCQHLLRMYDDFYPQIGFNTPWIGYFVVRHNTIVGACSFVGQPQDGKVEVSYWTFKAFEGQGIASFACRELLNIAYKTDPGIIITAKTAPEHNASTKILENNHFVFTEIVQDHEIGDAWLWTHSRTED
ncbi:MAG TPA: GNAT family N-acetyltransferase [Saprospiraceae bacterium]|nr:MAG: GNAT family N-acetyltransferase [Saprospiraceae bacterium]HND44452.1 GNAT family N-acetyltransferase [Cyclobacteriaceae bacterium]HMY84266.1 GNAT family N-acetyltransferase [Saprospiraceae bacterium]HMZ24199.1 GNAT family N-acetyltransferase [Saprospiraceae bacterium]HNA76472.1 GNAT family N-acetyltransferase [Saprospiraceae bacterium]